MPMFLIQSAILIAIAFIIGCILGCLLRRWFGADSAALPAAVAATAATAAVAPAIAAKVMSPEPEAAPAQTPALAAAVPASEPAKAEPAAAPAAVLPSSPAKPKPTAKPKAAKPKASTATKATPAKPTVAAAPAKLDDLKLIVGIGPVNERKLNAIGVNRFAHIAAWSPKDEAEIGQKLEFPGRIEREEWVRQAKALAAGGKSEDTSELARKRSPASAKPAAPKTAGLMASPAAKSAAPKGKAAQASALSAKPKAEKKPVPAKLAAPIGGKPDNLTLINGIGNVIEKKLHAMGVFHFAQIADWTKAQAEDFSKAVGFPGRADREGWMKEAAIFAKGGTTEHARKVEAGAIPSSRKSTAAEKGTKAKPTKKA